jgi:hypothetical protein
MSCFRVKFDSEEEEYQRPAPLILVAAGFYLMASVVMLYFGFSGSRTLNLWVGICILASLAGYFNCQENRSMMNIACGNFYLSLHISFAYDAAYGSFSP